MATKTSNYEFNKPEQNDFYDVDVQNENWDKVDEELSEFDDSGVTEDIKSFPDFLSKFVTGNKVAITLRNLKAGLQFVLHAGQIVNNCVTDNTGLPLSAAQGKVLKDLIDTTNNNLSNKADKTSLSSYALKSDLSSSQNRPYIVTCTNAIDQSLFMNAQFRARRTENGTGAAAFGFENVGVNSGALYLDPSDYKLHFINYEGKKFVINWTAEN